MAFQNRIATTSPNFTSKLSVNVLFFLQVYRDEIYITFSVLEAKDGTRSQVSKVGEFIVRSPPRFYNQKE